MDTNTTQENVFWIDNHETVWFGKKSKKLSPANMDCLEVFTSHPNQIISADTMARYLGALGRPVSTAATRTRIAHVRSALEELGILSWIMTHPGVGYEYRPNSKAKRVEPRRSQTERGPTPPVVEAHTPHQRGRRYRIGPTTGKPRSPKARKKLAARGKLKLHGKRNTYRYSSSK